MLTIAAGGEFRVIFFLIFFLKKKHQMDRMEVKKKNQSQNRKPKTARGRVHGRRVARLHRRRVEPPRPDARRARAQVGGGASARGQGARLLPRVVESDQPLLREPRAPGRRRGRGRGARLAVLRGAAAAGTSELRAALRRRGPARESRDRARRARAQRV